MKTFQNIKDFIKFSRINTGKTLISMGPNRNDFSYGDYKKPDFEQLGAAYKDFSVFASINLLSESVYGSGFKFEGGSTKGIKLCNSLVNKTSFKPSVVDGIKDAFIYGIGFSENIWEKDKSISNLKVVNVNTIDPKWDKKGRIEGYTQKIGIMNKNTLAANDLVLYRFFRQDDNFYGVGLIEPIYHLLEIRRDIIKSIKEIFQYLAMPPVHIVKQGAQTKSELEKAEKKFKEFHRKSYFVTSEKYEIRMLEVKKTLPDLSKYLEQIDMYISIGLRVPSKLLAGDISIVTKASAVALRQYSRDEIAYIRNKLARILDNQIFTPLCEDNGISEVPKIVWYPEDAGDPKIKTEIQLDKVKVIGALMEKNLISKGECKNLVDKIIGDLG